MDPIPDEPADPREFLIVPTDHPPIIRNLLARMRVIEDDHKLFRNDLEAIKEGQHKSILNQEDMKVFQSKLLTSLENLKSDTRQIVEWKDKIKIGAGFLLSTGSMVVWTSRIGMAILILIASWLYWKTGKFPTINIGD
jgi:hypothetical protein